MATENNPATTSLFLKTAGCASSNVSIMASMSSKGEEQQQKQQEQVELQQQQHPTLPPTSVIVSEYSEAAEELGRKQDSLLLASNRNANADNKNRGDTQKVSIEAATLAAVTEKPELEINAKDPLQEQEQREVTPATENLSSVSSVNSSDGDCSEKDDSSNHIGDKSSHLASVDGETNDFHETATSDTILASSVPTLRLWKGYRTSSSGKRRRIVCLYSGVPHHRKRHGKGKSAAIVAEAAPVTTTPTATASEGQEQECSRSSYEKEREQANASPGCPSVPIIIPKGAQHDQKQNASSTASSNPVLPAVITCGEKVEDQDPCVLVASSSSSTSYVGAIREKIEDALQREYIENKKSNNNGRSGSHDYCITDFETFYRNLRKAVVAERRKREEALAAQHLHGSTTGVAQPPPSQPPCEATTATDDGSGQALPQAATMCAPSSLSLSSPRPWPLSLQPSLLPMHKDDARSLCSSSTATTTTAGRLDAMVETIWTKMEDAAVSRCDRDRDADEDYDSRLTSGNDNRTCSNFQEVDLNRFFQELGEGVFSDHGAEPWKHRDHDDDHHDHRQNHHRHHGLPGAGAIRHNESPGGSSGATGPKTSSDENNNNNMETQNNVGWGRWEETTASMSTMSVGCITTNTEQSRVPRLEVALPDEDAKDWPVAAADTRTFTKNTMEMIAATAVVDNSTILSSKNESGSIAHENERSGSCRLGVDNAAIRAEDILEEPELPQQGRTQVKASGCTASRAKQQTTDVESSRRLVLGGSVSTVFADQSSCDEEEDEEDKADRDSSLLASEDDGSRAKGAVSVTGFSKYKQLVVRSSNIQASIMMRIVVAALVAIIVLLSALLFLCHSSRRALVINVCEQEVTPCSSPSLVASEVPPPVFLQKEVSPKHWTTSARSQRPCNLVDLAIAMGGNETVSLSVSDNRHVSSDDVFTEDSTTCPIPAVPQLGNGTSTSYRDQPSWLLCQHLRSIESKEDDHSDNDLGVFVSLPNAGAKNAKKATIDRTGSENKSLVATIRPTRVPNVVLHNIHGILKRFSGEHTGPSNLLVSDNGHVSLDDVFTEDSMTCPFPTVFQLGNGTSTSYRDQDSWLLRQQLRSIESKEDDHSGDNFGLIVSLPNASAKNAKATTDKTRPESKSIVDTIRPIRLPKVLLRKIHGIRKCFSDKHTGPSNLLIRLGRFCSSKTIDKVGLLLAAFQNNEVVSNPFLVNIIDALKTLQLVRTSPILGFFAKLSSLVGAGGNLVRILLLGISIASTIAIVWERKETSK